ncbi:dTDP-4-dehydrorhamnose reductase [Paenibacillus pasadenensis]|uniref:dTDP-4-dehydrorhamnose reductase n=1 Tax=Paenibacillus pasadenensis TaxID=217090 RepID=UPI00203E7700|nr:dTDP-4-dehydrorhamnose reductase [Paenibacillus pasadenensis]MCM3747644.1 dTDP-4-dehydrorhamnose reductase [Paenibacillus pasadenensis]
MKVLVTGANGQLGRELTLWETVEGIEIVGMGRKELDITSLEQCREAFAMVGPDVIINCAAYTSVDQAESAVEEAYQINASGARNVAIAAREIGAKLIHVSTDYVFDGKGSKPYQEYDATNPQTVYGKSKLVGEHLVQSLHDRWFIVRTSWVYGAYGVNFVSTMLKLGAERDSLSVVDDQVGSPTFTKDLAAFLLELAETEAYGIYHASSRGSCTWYDFAKAIFQEVGMSVKVNPCTTEEFPRAAARPAYSVLDHSAIRVNEFNDFPSWNDALKKFFKKGD